MKIIYYFVCRLEREREKEKEERVELERNEIVMETKRGVCEFCLLACSILFIIIDCSLVDWSELNWLSYYYYY